SQTLYLDVQKKYIVRIDSLSLAGTVVTLLEEVKSLPEFELPDLIKMQPELQLQPLLNFRPETREKYQEKEVTFLSQDTMLSGTLTLPRGNPPFPGILLIAGSGPVDRNGNVPQGIQLNILREIAYQLAECGFAVLRYDKRGVGKSGGNFASSGLYDLAKDAQNALEFLIKQPEINSQRVALLGHSEGGTIACMVASENPAVSALVLMATPARSLIELVKEQITYLYLISGVKDPQIIQEAIAQQNKIFEALAQGKKEVEGVPIPLWKWWKDYLEFDPQVFFKKIRVPTLILQGEKDYQVKTEDALRIAGILKQNGVPCELVIFPDLDHLFKPVKGDFSSPEEYPNTSRKTPQEVFEKICSFLKKNL
ncbi:MAG: alpha/beta fold hydrolase, partial [Candidatus Atribacteria bacterium]|nr:alpha/beta fold hydrolase [Candidatus Atribacteria bacterium]MCD6350226.1 alpha/beta fold hydrolase [Candidatus Atribacteria bacterium]